MYAFPYIEKLGKASMRIVSKLYRNSTGYWFQQFRFANIPMVVRTKCPQCPVDVQEMFGCTSLSKTKP